jgi:hypothetical protein
MDSDSHFKAANSTIKNLNKIITELNRARKENKINQKANKQKEIVERLRYVAESMREAGASEQSIRIAIHGTYEFLKVTYGVKLDKSTENIIKNPDSIWSIAKKHLAFYSQKLKHNKSIGYGKDISLLAKSPYWMETRAWENHYSPLILLPV